MKNLIFTILILFVCVQITTAQTFPIIYCDTGKQVVRILEYKSGGIMVNRGYYNGSTPYTPSSKIVPGNCDSTLTNQNKGLIDSLMANNTLTRRNLDTLVNNNTLTRRNLDTLVNNNTLTRRNLDTLAATYQSLKTGSALFRITNGTNTATVTASAVSASNLDLALVVDQRPITATFGSNTPTVTAYNTDANTISTTNCVRIVIENKSTSTDASISYGGQLIQLGKKGNTSGYNTIYQYDAIYDFASKKYSPFPTVIVNALASTVLVTKYFAQ